MNGVSHSPIPPLQPALRSFEAQWLSRAPAREGDPLAALRESAMSRVLRLGLPTARDESFRYTNLRKIASRTYQPVPHTMPAELHTTASLSLLTADERAATVLMVNGHPVLPLHMDAYFNGIEISSLQQMARTDPGAIIAHLDPLSDTDQARWGLLNAALFADGLYLRITGKVATPLVILHVLTADGMDRSAMPRVIIEATPESDAIIIEHYVEQGTTPPLCNSATHISMARDAQLEHYRVFATSAAANHIDSLNVRQRANSRCKQFSIVLGGGLVRTSLEAVLEEPGAHLDSHALLVGHESRHVDCVNIVNHNARDTRSMQNARAIASGDSRVVFNSKVVVSTNATHSESRQTCRGLLLSAGAEIDARPQLEIHTNEVKCAHGATTGRLDPDMLFYLLSRGLDRQTAQSILIYAFLADVFVGMSVQSARKAIEDALISQLPDSQILRNFR